MVTTHASSLLSDSADLVSAARAHWWVWSSKIAFSALGKPGGEDADPQRNDNAFWWMPGARWRQQLLATESHRPSAASSLSLLTGLCARLRLRQWVWKGARIPFQLLFLSSEPKQQASFSVLAPSLALGLTLSGSLPATLFPSCTQALYLHWRFSVSNLKQAQQPVSHRCPAPSSANSLFPLTERFFCEKQITKHVLAFLIHKGVQSHWDLENRH